MVDVIIRELLGNWGGALLDIYLKYSLYIHSIIFLYVILVILSRRNYHFILNNLIRELNHRYQNKIRRVDRRQIEAILKSEGVPWEDALKVSGYPFITPPRRISLHFKSMKTIQRMIPVEALAVLLEQKNHGKGDSF